MSSHLLAFLLATTTILLSAQGPYITVSSSGQNNPAGLFVYRFQDQKLVLVEKSDNVKSTSYHNFHPTKPWLYAVGSNKVYAFSFDPEKGHLTLLNEQDSQGSGPCFVSVDESGKYVFVANYSGATISVYPIQPDGQLGPSIQKAEHRGSSIDTTRQKEAHPHQILPAPGNEFVVVPDLGTDKIDIYQFNAKNGTIKHHGFGKALPGSGPRHLEFHPTLPFVYVLNELNSSVGAYRWITGRMEQIATYPLLADDFHDFNKSADIHLTSNGKLLYATNRGHNSLTSFKVNKDGTLIQTGRFTSGGNFPRNFYITPDDQYLLVANQMTHNILQYLIDKKTGALSKLSEYTDIPGAQCIKSYNWKK